MLVDALNIQEELMAFMQLQAVDDFAFNAMALKLFKYQAQWNLPYQRFCQIRGKTPRTVTHWHDIPSVPINAFKDLDLTCTPPADCEHVFMTSGTTRGDVKGRHYHPSLLIYDTSMRLNFAQRLTHQKSKIRMGILFPTAEMMPNSSLAHYLELALTHFGTQGSQYFIDPTGLNIQGLASTLQEIQKSGEPIALLGASYSWVHAMDQLDVLNLTFKLPAASWLLDTGGFKGQSRELSANEFYATLSTCLGVSAQQCLNMYGMTELSTQFYDQGPAFQPVVKTGPHWIRTRVLDPLTGQELPAGQVGVLAHTDLANFNSVLTILTEDLGHVHADGFVLLGRAQGAQAKGCSLAVEHFLQAAQA